jgi:hypothetical protein
MVAYEYYCRDETDRVHFIGIIPERRGKLERITDESILNLGKIILGEDAGLSNLFFVQITIDRTSVISYPDSPFYELIL